ncbi:hypothetical protein V8C86DRAFT_2688487 [Haematococcus lacustris]
MASWRCSTRPAQALWRPSWLLASAVWPLPQPRCGLQGAAGVVPILHGLGQLATAPRPLLAAQPDTAQPAPPPPGRPPGPGAAARLHGPAGLPAPSPLDVCRHPLPAPAAACSQALSSRPVAGSAGRVGLCPSP